MDVQAYIKQICQKIVERFRPEKIILFGSYANGVPNFHSDIDLLVVMPFEGRVHELSAKIRRELGSEMPIDLLVRTPEQVKERVEMEDFFMREIVEQGKVLYEADHA